MAEFWRNFDGELAFFTGLGTLVFGAIVGGLVCVGFTIAAPKLPVDYYLAQRENTVCVVPAVPWDQDMPLACYQNPNDAIETMRTLKGMLKK